MSRMRGVWDQRSVLLERMLEWNELSERVLLADYDEDLKERCRRLMAYFHDEIKSEA